MPKAEHPDRAVVVVSRRAGASQELAVGCGALLVGIWLVASGEIPTNAFVIASFVAAPLVVWGRWERPRSVQLAIGFPIMAEVIGLILMWTAPLLPHTFDTSLARLDHVLWPWVDSLAVWTRAHQSLYLAVETTYVALPIFAALVIRIRGTGLIWPLLGAGAVGWALYWIVPATGPAYHGTLPAPRNAVPSLHVTWALLLATAIWDYRVVRPITVILVALTILATIAIGEHYGIDLVFAVPFAAAVWQAYRRRWVSSAIFGTMLLTSLFALRLSLS